MKVDSIQYGFIVFAIFLGSIISSMASGLWESIPTVESMTDSTNGKINPDEIKGSMTFIDIEKISGIGLEKLKIDLGLPEDVTREMQIKQVKDFVPGWETEVLREYFSERNLQRSAIAYPCPYGIKNDPYPGEWGLYVDNDSDGLCDYT